MFWIAFAFSGWNAAVYAAEELANPRRDVPRAMLIGCVLVAALYLAVNFVCVRVLGPEHVILSSDLGQAGNPLHPDGLAAFFEALRREGFTQAEIDRMSKTNPATLMGW